MHIRRVASAAVGLVLLVRAARRWFPVKVAGESMAPTLAPGDMLAVRPLRAGEPKRGQIVVAARDDIEVVKRVTVPPADGLVWLEGDNAAASTDSRMTGPVPVADVVGVVRARYRPLSRARLL